MKLSERICCGEAENTTLLPLQDLIFMPFAPDTFRVPGMKSKNPSADFPKQVHRGGVAD
jgi:hypothetical protein